MSENEFYEALAAARDKFDWAIDGCGMIRALPKKECFIECFCPITAVCFAVKKQQFDSDDYIDAADCLGLRNFYAENIADAADEPLRNMDGNTASRRKHRHKLLTALGLTEP